MADYLYSFLLVACLLFGAFTPAGAQIIETIENTVESGGSGSENQVDYDYSDPDRDTYNEPSGFDPPSIPPSNYDYYEGEEDYDDEVTVIHLEGFYYLVKSTSFLLFGFPDGQNPFRVAEEGGIEFSEYPYDAAHNGVFRRPGELGFRSRIYAGAHFINNEQNLSGGLLQIRYYPIRAFSFELSHLQLVEKLEDRQGHDFLGFSTLAAQYNRLRHHRVHAWWGLGFSQMSGENNYGGFALHAGTTVFIHKPISLHLEGQAMWMNGVAVQLYQGRLQAHLKRFQIYTGYYGIRVRYDHFPSWVLGTGVWF